MRSFTLFERLGWSGGWALEIGAAAAALAVGFGVMPLLIFWAGSALLGRYDGASIGHLYDSVYRELGTGSFTSLLVVFGPFGLYLLFKGLRLWWRASARLG